MANSNLNNFIVVIYGDGKVLLDFTADHLTQYVEALKISKVITVKGEQYKFVQANLEHISEGKLTVKMHIHLKRIA